MGYKVEFSPKAEKELNKLDQTVIALILKWLKKNVDGSEDPRIHGKPLKGRLSGYWRYRVGDYRIICTIQDDKLIVLVVTKENHSTVYDRIERWNSLVDTA